LRSASILLKLAPTIFAFLRDRRRWIFFGSSREVQPETHRRRAEKLRVKVEQLGPTFIKLSQILSTRADLLPPEYIKELAKLQDRVPPTPAADIKRVIEQDLGRPAGEVFERFDDNALAAASLGQVHRARYKGEEVVVKVLRPGVPNLVRLDLRIMGRILDTLNSYIHHHFLTAFTNVFNEYGRIIEEEMDFVEEANNANRFRENLKDTPRVIIPEVYREVSSARVIVLKYYEGIKISDVEALKRAKIDVFKVIEDLIEIYARMMLIDRFFHADPHPGNLLIIPAAAPGEEKIVMLDFGMVIKIDESTKDKLLRAAAAWARRDIDELVSCLYDLDVIDPEVNTATVTDAARELVDIIDRYRFSQRRIQQYFTAVLDTFYKFPIRMPSNLVYIAKTGIVLEGIGVSHDPSFDGARAATPVIKRLLKTTLVDPKLSPVEYLMKKVKEIHAMVSDMERFFRHASRDDIRVRAHPSDMAEIERFLSTTNHRIMASVFILAVMVVTAILFLHTTSGWLLGGGLGGSFLLFLIIYMLPSRPKNR
jgi:predicted unusual protein kinase regulating ubiquinone biosynthesis (AarF/ABC1/UbiB family)